MDSAPFRVLKDGTVYIAGFTFSGSTVRNSSSYSSFPGSEFFLYSTGDGFMGFRYSTLKWVGIGLSLADSTVDSTMAPQVRSTNTVPTTYAGYTKYNVWIETRGSTERNVHLYIPNAGGWDASPISIESRRFSNESSGFKRTCLVLSLLPYRSNINTLGTVDKHPVYWDGNSGHLFWE
jgi:hypothetical protein